MTSAAYAWRIAVAAAMAMLLGMSTAQGAAYWLFLEHAPGWRPGDPVPAAAVETITAEGLSVRTISRYFDAVSVEWDGAESRLAAIPGVRDVRPVRTIGRMHEHTPVAKPAKPAHTESGSGEHLFDYGESYQQLRLLKIPVLHDLGLTGRGVVIGVLDGGFVTGGIACLADIDVAGVRNFVTNGTDVGNGGAAGNQHGTQVLACLAGKQPGSYYGAAFGATYLLALTEDVNSETPAEEDRWVAGVEWCDSLGVDIISSSLVYNEFDGLYRSYTVDEMDGETSLVARAAETAWSRGILVVNAAGNEGGNSWNIVATPADAKHVLSVGAFWSLGSDPSRVLSSSSRGPTADGRIKPDVIAPGGGVYAPEVMTSAYNYYSGTSYSTPLVAGLCALLMEAHPTWTNADVFDAVKTTAIDLGNAGPDNTYGWGVPDALAAYDYDLPMVVVADDSRGRAAVPGAIEIRRPFPNPFNASVTIPYTLDRPLPVTVDMYDIVGRHIERLRDDYTPAGSHEAVWRGDNAGSGVYIVRIAGGGGEQSARVVLVK